VAANPRHAPGPVLLRVRLRGGHERLRFAGRSAPGPEPGYVSVPLVRRSGDVDKQRSGTRVYDINRDGVAHYGLYPDWIEDTRKVAGRDGPTLMREMGRGAEAYLRLWARAQASTHR